MSETMLTAEKYATVMERRMTAGASVRCSVCGSNGWLPGSLCALCLTFICGCHAEEVGEQHAFCGLGPHRGFLSARGAMRLARRR